MVLVGSVNLDDVFGQLVSFSVRKENRILKTQAQYMDAEKTSILVDSLAIEGKQKSSFFVLVGARSDGLVVRIHPNSYDIEKTDAVKMVLAEIAKQLLEKFPDLKVGKTNLQDFL